MNAKTSQKILAWIATLSLFMCVTALWEFFNAGAVLKWRVSVSRTMVIVIFAHLFLFAAIFYKQTWITVKNFFTEAQSPVNLALFRIYFFATWLGWDGKGYITLSQNPPGMRFAPRGLTWVLHHVPMDPFWMTWAVAFFKIFVFTSFIGFYTRVSCLLAALLALYAFGVPQFMGKINHTHHLVWLMLMLATSRCGDVLSLDAWLSARRGRPRSLGRSYVYALPIRFIWLLIGVLYFFPGFWKIWDYGLDWIVSDNLKFHLYHKWLMYPNWHPLFRIDHYPWLLKLSALGVVIFEMSFFFLMFFPGWRYVGVAGGFLFHRMTDLFMKIGFDSLQKNYVVFFNGQRILQWMSEKVFRKKISWLEEDKPRPSTKATPWATIFMGTILLIGNIYCGFYNIHSWPFSCYPTFSFLLRESYTWTITMEVRDLKGDLIPLKTEEMSQFYSPDRFREIYGHVIGSATRAEQKYRLRNLWELWAAHEPELKQKAQNVRFYLDFISIIPEERNNPPLERELLLEMKLKGS
jgi:hypothetical protein